MNPTDLLRGNVWHELLTVVHCSKGKVVSLLSGKSVIAVGEVVLMYAQSNICGQGMLCTVRGIVLVARHYVTCVCTWW